MDKIGLKALYFEACHGVLDFEKVNKQPFVIDLELGLDLSGAGMTDGLGETVDYSKVYELVRREVTKESHDLIERLAYRILMAVLAYDEKILRARVTVHKPKAPIEGRFDDVCVVMERDRDVLLLS